MERSRSGRSTASDGEAARAPRRREFAKLVKTVAEFDRRVTRDREDIDIQFRRLAELQAVIDRMQLAAGKARAKPDGRGE